MSVQGVRVGPGGRAVADRAGPAAEPGVSIFAQPQFREHVGFLQRMASRGYLVAAGPLPDVMTAEQLSATFGMPLQLEEHDGRFSARRQRRH